LLAVKYVVHNIHKYKFFFSMILLLKISKNRRCHVNQLAKICKIKAQKNNGS